MTTGDLVAELRRSRTDLPRVVEAAARPERAYVVVPAQAVTAWMEREPDAWAKVVEWFAANGKALVPVQGPRATTSTGDQHQAGSYSGPRASNTDTTDTATTPGGSSR